MTQRVGFIDALRGVAIIIVVFYHCLVSDFHGSIVANTLAGAGVAIFFAISGFCIHLSFSKNSDWRTFWIRRFFRIYPAYLFAVIFCALAFQNKDAWQLASHLLLIHNLFADTYFGLNLAFWSIAVEVQLYAIYPILLILTRRFGWRRTLWVLAIIEVSLRLFIAAPFTPAVPIWVAGQPLFFWFSWAVGAEVAESYIKGQDSALASYSPIWLAAAGIISSVFVELISFTFYAFASAAFIARHLKSGVAIRPAVENHLAQAGLWSYSLYLIHEPLIRSAAAGFRALALPSWSIFLLCMTLYPLFLRMAGGLYGLVERPGIAFGNRLLRKPVIERVPA